ncbi:MAG: sigma-54 dependent transcriptional regulator [Pirellulaceae bacterium]
MSRDTIDNASRSALPVHAESPKRFPHTQWVLGENASIRRIARHVERAAEVECTVLITGETGTGKEVWASLVHEFGPRQERPFIPVNCAALTATLAESQLFGHEKGAFTGATGASLGVFRAAEGGIVFLDEVGEMPLELQPKLLRVLQQAEVTPVGSTSPIPINVQVVAATNRDLEEEVREGRFREDLYFRLNMVELRIPSLRERPEDIPSFVEFFSHRYSQRYQREMWRPNPDELVAFCEYEWPGNIRQLSHAIEQAYVLDCAPTLPTGRNRDTVGQSLPFFNLDRLKATAVAQALRATRGHKGQAARLLGVHANTMTRLIAQTKSSVASTKEAGD